MNKTKNLLILCLVALLGVVSTIPSTFSWYTRAAKQTGGVLHYERNKLPISAGTVSIETEQYDTEDNQIKYNSKKEKVVKSSVSYNVSKKTINYYKSTLKNNTNGDAYVNMYLKNASNNAGLYIGSLEPTLNYKQVGAPMRKSVSNSRIMVYFQKNTEGTAWSGTPYVWAVHPNSSGAYVTDAYSMTKVDNSYKHKGTGSMINTYYCLLPENTKEFYFVKQDKTSNYTNPTGFDRTPTISSFRPSILYSLTGRTTDDNKNYAEFLKYEMPDGLIVPTYYSSITTAVNRSIYLRLPAGAQYKEVAYTKNDTSVSNDVYEIDDIGRVKIKTSAADTEKIKTTLTGPLGETMQFLTEIKVGATVEEFPIIQNVLVPAQSKIVVEWYAENKLTPASANDTDTLSIGTLFWTV